ncbi:MAG: SpoVG family protein [Ruminococcus sp.]|nr:SpoVG family protein [Ruminococcus sp.]
MAQTYRNNNQRNNQNQQTRKQNTPAIRAKIDRLVDGDGNTRAYASINVAGAVAIHGIRVMDSRKGVFVSMPNRSYKDSNGNTQYSDIAHAVTKEVREAINKQVLDAYNQALEESQNDGFTDMGDDDDLPFDEDEDGSMDFAPSM